MRFKRVAVLLHRHPVRIHLKNQILFVREPQVLLFIPHGRPQIIRSVGEESGVEVDALDRTAGLGGHMSWEIDFIPIYSFIYINN
jgi:hypothetical protein